MNAIIPFAYQYALGGLIFGTGIYFGVKGGFLGFEAGPKRRNLLLSFGGLFLLAGIQGYLQFVAPLGAHSPPSSELLPTGQFDRTLDYGIMIGYLVVILGLGIWFGRHSSSTKDFFFGGQRFSWWFITMSLVATTVGSYSFVKYSKVAYQYGVSSSLSYLNDWFWVPLFLFGWLPIIFFSRVVSIPEYFDRRFGSGARLTVTIMLLIYLIGYVGINLYTMGKALHYLVGVDVLTAAIAVACFSAVYVTWGGQTSVIVTDLFQGIMLFATGLLILWLGFSYFDGFDGFWAALKPDHRMAFTNFNEDPSFSTVGIFWQDAAANTAVFYFLNQGVMMRFLSVKSVNEGKKALIATVAILMPIAAIVVASGGWIGSAMQSAGMIPVDVDPKRIFFIVADIIAVPGVFGLVMAALTAALMSTVDTLITAVAAVCVNDVYRPYIKPNQADSHYLKIARYTSIGATLVGISLVPVFDAFGSIYSAHGAFTAAVTPPLVVALLFAFLWPRFTSAAAVSTIAGGFALVMLSVVFPELVAPFSHGIPRTAADGTLLEGAKAYKFTRAFYGISVSVVIGIVVTFLTQPKSRSEILGLTFDTSTHFAKTRSSNPMEVYAAPVTYLASNVGTDATVTLTVDGLPRISVSQALAESLGAVTGDRLLISDHRWWYGGLRSTQIEVGDVDSNAQAPDLGLDHALTQRIRASASAGIVVERLL